MGGTARILSLSSTLIFHSPLLHFSSKRFPLLSISLPPRRRVFQGFRPLCSSSTAATTTAETDNQDFAPAADKHTILLERLRLRHLKDGGTLKTPQQPKPPKPLKSLASSEIMGKNDGAHNVDSGFEELGLSEEVTAALEEMGISVPTEIQSIGIAAVLQGKSVVLGSHTGSGKTLAYLLPIVQVFDFGRAIGQLHGHQKWSLTSSHRIHSGSALLEGEKEGQSEIQSEGSSVVVEGAGSKVKRKKLKGKRAVVRWLKFFRWKKKRDYQRMADEEKLLYKLNKAQKKEQRLLDSLKKIELNDSSETKHDPEILTPEEHFYFLKMGLKCNNYVPVGRRGIYQGVILNMHLHWKKHQTLQVIVKTFSPEEVKEIATELARLSGGIVLDIHEENTIIMYRGKNYAQPPTEIMSPRVTLSRKKALDKSKYRDALRAVRRYIPRLEQELELLRARIRNNEDNSTQVVENPESVLDGRSEKLKEMIMAEDGPLSDDKMVSDSEDLSDMFESDLDVESEEDEPVRPLYLHTFDKFPAIHEEPEDFEEQLKKISSGLRRPGLCREQKGTPDLDEVDQIFLRAATLLKKKR